MTPKVQATKEKIGQLDFSKIKSFCASGDTIKKAKTTHRMEKIFASYISIKELISGIYKDLLILNNKKT